MDQFEGGTPKELETERAKLSATGKEVQELRKTIDKLMLRIGKLEAEVERLNLPGTCEPSEDGDHFTNRPPFNAPLQPIPEKPRRQFGYRIRMVPDVYNGGYMPTIESGQPVFFPFFGPVWSHQHIQTWPKSYHRY